VCVCEREIFHFTLQSLVSGEEIGKVQNGNMSDDKTEEQRQKRQNRIDRQERH